MLAAVLAEGTTVIKNSAREPEIEDLQKYLNAIGGKVKGAGTGEIVVEGVKELHDCEEHSIMPDRIEAGTYMIASAATGGKVFVRNIVPSHVFSLIELLYNIGCKIEIYHNAVYVESTKRKLDTLGGISVRTLPYPGFPTDLQAPLTSLLSVTSGASVVEKQFLKTDSNMCLNWLKWVPILSILARKAYSSTELNVLLVAIWYHLT